MSFRIGSLLLVAVLLGIGGCSQNTTGPNSAGQWAEATAKAPFSGRYGLAGTVFGGAMWVIGGAAGNANGSVTYYDSDVWSSGNGSSWSQSTGSAPFGGRFGSRVLSYNGLLWLIGGNSGGNLMNDVWSSPDGVNWTNVLANSTNPGLNQFTGREDFGAVVFNNLMWVIGGWAGTNMNDVWSSPDGVNWTNVLANGGANAGHFGGRWGFSTVVYNNAMWLMGGAGSLGANFSPNTAYADVWTSANGNVWTRLSLVSPFNDLYFSQASVFNNSIWLTGGYLWNNFGPQYGVFTSTNGTAWAAYDGNFPPRFGHLSLTYNNSIWIIGGCNNACQSAPCPTTVTYYNDVWDTQ